MVVSEGRFLVGVALVLKFSRHFSGMTIMWRYNFLLRVKCAKY